MPPAKKGNVGEMVVALLSGGVTGVSSAAVANKFPKVPAMAVDAGFALLGAGANYFAGNEMVKAAGLGMIGAAGAGIGGDLAGMAASGGSMDGLFDRIRSRRGRRGRGFGARGRKRRPGRGFGRRRGLGTRLTKDKVVQRLDKPVQKRFRALQLPPDVMTKLREGQSSIVAPQMPSRINPDAAAVEQAVVGPIGPTMARNQQEIQQLESYLCDHMPHYMLDE